MTKRAAPVAPQLSDGLLASPGLKSAPVLEMMCSQFVLTLAAKQGAKFNVRRDLTACSRSQAAIWSGLCI